MSEPERPVQIAVTESDSFEHLYVLTDQGRIYMQVTDFSGDEKWWREIRGPWDNAALLEHTVVSIRDDAPLED